jgi:hypothetical protein
MGSPAIFAGSRTKFLTAGGIELPNRTTAQRDALTPVQGQTIYNSTTGAIEYFDGAVWKTLLESSSKINYFSDFSAKDLNKFIIYNDSSGATPTDGVGGTPNITKSLNTSTPLIGVTSYRMSKDAVNRQGQGFSITTDIPLDAPITAGEPITVQFRYRTSANYATGDVRMFVYFVGPNTLQALNGVSNTGEFGNNLVKSFDDRSQFTAITSCPAGTTAIRVIGHIATASTLSYQIDIDEITIGTASTLTAPIATDWVPYTPPVAVGSGSITNFVASGFWKRDGDDIIVKGTIRFTGNSGTWSGGLFVGLPSPFTVDYSKVKNVSSSAKVQRTGTTEFATPNLVAVRGTLVFADTLSVNPNTHFAFNPFFVKTDDAGVAEDFVRHTGGAALSSTVIGTTANNDYITWDDVRIPVTQFTQGSNVISSTQANFFRGGFRATRNNVNQTGINPNGGSVKINFNSVSGAGGYLTGGFTYDTANSRFVAHKKLTLLVNARVTILSTNTLNSPYAANITKNNGQFAVGGQSQTPPAGQFLYATASGIVTLDPGETLEVFFYGSGNNSSNHLTMLGNHESYFEAIEIPDLSVVGISGAPLEILHTISSQKTPAGTGQWHAHTGNSLTLTPGVWRLSARGGFFNNGSSAGYTRVRIQIGSSNGGDSGTEPPASGPNFEVLDGNVATNLTTSIPLPGGSEDIILPAPQKIVSVVSTQTFFANSLALMATPANSRITVSLTAERIR